MLKKYSLAAAVLVVCSLPVAAFAAGNSLTLKNESKWEIHELYVSPADQSQWGPDQLREQTIAPGASFTLNGIPADKYDFKLVDEDGDTCVVPKISVTESGTTTITNENLLGCQSATGGGAEEE